MTGQVDPKTGTFEFDGSRPRRQGHRQARGQGLALDGLPDALTGRPRRLEHEQGHRLQGPSGSDDEEQAARSSARSPET